MGQKQSLLPSQAATISPEAAKFIQNLPHIPFAGLLASWLTSPRRIGGFREKFGQKQREKEEALIAKYRLKVTDRQIEGVKVIVIEPPSIAPEAENKILFNIHGGAFVLGTARDRTGLMMAAEMGILVYSVEYTLAPEARYPVAILECLGVYRKLVDEFGAGNIYAMSSSSGSQIMMSMLLRARADHGLAMPAAQYLCTPATELHMIGDSSVTNASRDVMPLSMLVGMVRQNYHDGSVDEKDPLYSPIYAKYDSSYPPTVITVGTRDVMLSTGVRMYWTLQDAGVKVELLVSEGMWHGFNWEDTMPEAIQARAAVRLFLLGNP
jgi:monoterpene epsilon-lactone hydrolase